MPVLTDLASAAVKRGVKKLFGQTLTRPALLVSDGFNVIYACDVNIGPVDPTGRINQYINEKNGDPVSLTNLPGQTGFQLGDDLTVNTILRNVVVARNNAALIYADVGSPVVLERNDSGQWQIMGFSIEMPGTYTLTPITIPDLVLGTVQSDTLTVPGLPPPIIPVQPPIVIGDVIDLSITTRRLTYEELGTLAPYGTLPYGATAIYVGGTLLRIV